MTRRRCERGLLIVSAGGLVDRLARELGEVQVALELGIVIVLTMGYLQFRTIDGPPPDPNKRRGSGETIAGTIPGNSGRRKSSPSWAHVLPLGVREKRNSMSTGQPAGAISGGNLDIDSNDREDRRPGSIGTVWATETRDYRECLDDGAAWAFLLGPILSGSMFYETCTRLRGMYADGMDVRGTDSVSNGWQVEPPLVSPSTRPFFVAGHGPSTDAHARDPAILAISALAYSRKQACHLMCLLSLLLFAHALWSRKRHFKVAELQETAGAIPSPWSKRSEWRRTGAIVAFSFVLTAGFVVLKIAAQMAGVVGSYGESSRSLFVIRSMIANSLRLEQTLPTRTWSSRRCSSNSACTSASGWRDGDSRWASSASSVMPERGCSWRSST